MTTKAHACATRALCGPCATEHGYLAGVACGTLHPQRHLTRTLAHFPRANGEQLVGALLATAGQHPHADFLTPILTNGEWGVEVWQHGRARVVVPNALARLEAVA